jgi:hypothetical protein
MQEKEKTPEIGATHEIQRVEFAQVRDLLRAAQMPLCGQRTERVRLAEFFGASVQ